MKNSRLLLFVVFLFSLLLTGCISQGGPLYVDSIEVYSDNELVTGKYLYHTSTGWNEFDDSKKTDYKMYYGVNLNKDLNVKVVFNIYAPNTTLNSLRILLNIDLDYNSNQTAFIEEEDITKDGNIFKCKYTFSPTDDFNCMTVTGFATDDGLKYMGAKDKRSNFVLWGTYLKY